MNLISVPSSNLKLLAQLRTTPISGSLYWALCRIQLTPVWKVKGWVSELPYWAHLHTVLCNFSHPWSVCVLGPSSSKKQGMLCLL